MNRKSALALVAIFSALASSHASAETPTIDNTQFVSTKSRTQVQAELVDFNRQGVNPWSTSYNPLASFKSTKTRDQVTAEYVADRDQVAAMSGEDGGSLAMAQGGAGKTNRITIAAN
jgi:Domain of unknown function (DUF4148)